MTTCADKDCNVEFGRLTNKERSCSICAKKFCSVHACSASPLKHFAGLHLPLIEKVIGDKKGFICTSCFDKSGLSLQKYEKSIFKKLCACSSCKEEIKYSCKSCGEFYCNKHASDVEMPKEWLKQHVNYPDADRLCSVCLSEKESKCLVSDDSEHDLDSSFLKLLAGKPDGERQCIIVHGIMSGVESMSQLADTLVEKNSFDAVWGFNSIAYRGRTNEAKSFDITDIPLGIDSIIKTIGKVAFKQMSKMIDLPAYIVEGAAQELFQAIKNLNISNITLIGHSLGGLVCRCAVESYSGEQFVKSVITLASPQRLWLKTYGSKLTIWKQKPNANISYLAVLGKDDPVAIQSWSDYTEDDAQFHNVIKVLVSGGHSSIHEKSHGTYVPELMAAFINNEINANSELFYVVVEESNPYLRYQPLHDVRKTERVDTPHGQWLDFMPSK